MKSAILILMIVILVIGVPLGYMLGIVTLAGLAEMGGWSFLRIIATRFHSGVESFLLIAIPFFILAAMIMNKSGLTDRLIRFVNLLIGHYPGGLSHVNIGGSIVFAGMTGAAVTRLDVKTPAATASFSETIKARSIAPSFLRPAATAEPLNP